MSPQTYEDLLCRGWRRSGICLYKPDQRAQCCPHYTIKLDPSEFKATKDQRQTLNRFNRFVLGEEYIKECAKLYPKSKEEAARRKQEFNLSERLHESEWAEVRKTQPLKPAHDFRVSVELDSYTEEKYHLFENYQRLVHKEPPHHITKTGFRSFLCESFLHRISPANPHGQKLGSYHQCYRLDGKLVAMGVVDVLPNAISGVYFIYHESIQSWAPGKLSALREIAFTAEEEKSMYMMGFYIHNCNKMRYKMDFHPQYVLDMEDYTWHLLDADLLKRLDARKYVSFSSEKKAGIAVPETDTEAKVEEAQEEADDKYNLSDEEVSDASNYVEDIPLWLRNMPGILPRSELTDAVLDKIKIRHGNRFAKTTDLMTWADDSIDDPHTFKRDVAELVAAVGIDVAMKICIQIWTQ